MHIGKSFIEDKSGYFHKGIIKSEIEQGLFIIDAQLNKKLIPSPSLYKPEFVSMFLFYNF